MTSVDAVILAGGLGTRLRNTVGDRPKPLAMVNGRPFLDILVDDLVRQRIGRIVMCVGHRREQIVSHFSGRTDAEFVFSEESMPLGTGGAVKHATPLIRTDPFLLLNGDSFCRVDYRVFLAFHKAKASAMSMVVAEARGRSDAGNVEVAPDGRITAFGEKSSVPGTRTLINAGIYLIPRKLPESWYMQCPFSLEHAVFPELVGSGICYGYVVDEEVIDIGTPERYFDAQMKL